MNQKNYYLGLDVGTNSVGWAVTDENYELLKLKGKRAWGVRLFDEANTAKERRQYRSNRRRKKRQEWRLELIRKLFEDEISKVDDAFFIRMENSKYFVEDKAIKEKYVLFADKKYTDKEYFKEYPTIYHLRKELMESEKPHDVRLVFLAIYHIVKHRGHFLWDSYNINDSSNNNIEKLVDDYLELIKSTYNIDLEIETGKLVNILTADSTKNDKKRELKKLIENSVVDEHCQKNILNLLYLIIGSIVKIKDFIEIDDDDYKEYASDEIKTLSFEDIDEDKMDSIIQLVSSQVIELIEQGKVIYDGLKLGKILGNCTSVSESKIKDYNKHKSDLKILKKLIKQYLPGKYNEIFNEFNDKKNYAAYTGRLCINQKKKYVEGCSREDFYKYIKNIIKGIDSIEALETVKTIELEIQNNNFLPLERWSDNGVIPNQLHRYELEKILNNAKKYLIFLDQKDGSGLSIIDKVLKTFDFRIPYYIGPLNNHHKNSEKTHNRKGAWLTFKDNKQKLYPWNYMEQIDVNKTAEDFITRMTNKCTYLPNEDVLPKNSLLYQEYMVLNEINVLRINNNRLSQKEKEAVLKLFKKKKNVKIKNIIECLELNGFYNKVELTIDNFTGVNKSKDIISSLSSYHKFKEFFKDDIDKDKIKELIERIIFYLTIYNDGGNIAKERISKELGNELKLIFKNDYEKNINKISKIKLSGWGNFSKKFLEYEGIKKDADGGGVKKTIICHLRENSLNLMEIIETDKFDYKVNLKNEKKRQAKELNYDIVDELYVSPSVKRSIWQTLRIVDEIIRIIGRKPSKVFIEMARSNEEKVETISRKNALIKLYENLDIGEYEYIKKSLENETDSSLRKKDLYLYYTQLGRDMYSGEAIDLDQLKNRKTYDIDHIYPRSKSAQDSITKNLVLVKKSVNSTKSDVYPISPEIQHKMKSFWGLLKSKNLITAEKYNRLIRTTSFDDDELVGFIDRQLVETRQSTKEIKNIISDYLNPGDGQDVEIVSVHANLVSKFRNGENMKKDEEGNVIKYTNFPKVRILNDFHHAKDAYLNIVVGNVYNTKFTNNVREWIKDNRDKYSLNWVFGYNVDKAWNAGETGTIKQIEKVMESNDILVTKLTYEDKGMLFKEQAWPSKINDAKSKATASLKGKGALSNIEKYGGYTEVKIGYFVICKYDLVEEKNNEKRTTKIKLRPVAIKDLMTIRNSKEYLLSSNKKAVELKCVKDILINNICMELKINKNCIENFEFIKDKVLKNSVISINKFKYYLVGESDLCSAEELVINAVYERYLKRISKYILTLDNLFNGKEVPIEAVNDYAEKGKISKLENIELYDLILEKFENTLYSNRVGNISNVLAEKRDEYIKLNLYLQCKTILKVLENFECTSTKRIKLPMLGVNKEIGRLSKTINFDRDKVILYNYSITGLYCEKEYIDGLESCKNK